MKRVALALTLLVLFSLSVPSWAISCSNLASCTGGGTQVASPLLNQATGSYTGPKAPIGSVSSWVFTGDSNNTLGGLTFVYQVSLTQDDLSSITVGNNFDLAATADFGGTGKAPLFGGNNLNGGVTFTFFPNAQAPFTSQFLIVYTDQPTYNQQTASLNDTGTSAAADLGPMATVPEPASMALFGSGLVGLAGMIRRRKSS
jgi:hypothetical protein